MSRKCCVVGCKSERKYGDSSAPQLFKLPKTRKRLEEWLPAIGRYDLLKRILHKRSNFQLWLRVCEKHFEKHETRKLNHIKIRRESVPSLSLPSPRLGIKYVKHKANKAFHMPEKLINLNHTPLEIVDVPPTVDLTSPLSNNAPFQNEDSSHSFPNSYTPNNLATQEGELSIPVSTQLSPAHQNEMPIWSIPGTSQILPLPHNAMTGLSAAVPSFMPPLQTMMPSLSMPIPSQISPAQTFMPVFSIPVNSQLSSAPQMTMPVLPTPVTAAPQISPASQNEISAWSAAVAPQISPARNVMTEYPVPVDSQFLSASQTAMSELSIPISVNLSPAPQNAIPAWSAPVSSGPHIAMPGLSIPVYAEIPQVQPETQTQSEDVLAHISGAQTIMPAMSVPASSQISPALQTVPALSLSVTTQILPGFQNTSPALSTSQMSLAPHNVMPGWSVPVASQLLPAPHTVIQGNTGWSFPIPSQIPPSSLSLGGWSDILAPNPPIFTFIPAPQMNFTTPYGGLPNFPVIPDNFIPATPPGFNFHIPMGNIPMPTTASTPDHPFLELTLPEIEHILKQELEIPKEENGSSETETVILIEDGNEGESLNYNLKN